MISGHMPKWPQPSRLDQSCELTPLARTPQGGPALSSETLVHVLLTQKTSLVLPHCHMAGALIRSPRQ